MSYSMQLATNIYVVTKAETPLTSLLELQYWQTILRKLRSQLGEARFDAVTFQLVFGDNTVVAEPKPGMPNVFIVADEGQTLRPNLYDGQSLVFHSSYDGKIFKGQYDKLYPFPIGYNGLLDLDNPVPFAERTLNVFFSGNLHRGRRRLFNFYSYLGFLPFALQHRLQARLGSHYDHKYPSSYLRFTNGFMSGLQPAEYARYIKNSKIVLTPPGSVADECFRHYEAMKAGCIIVSERLPDNPFFSGSPIIQVDSWREGDKEIKQLLANPARMQELHEAALRWWRDVMSETAVAGYMAAKISQDLPLVAGKA